MLNASEYKLSVRSSSSFILLQ